MNDHIHNKQPGLLFGADVNMRRIQSLCPGTIPREVYFALSDADHERRVIVEELEKSPDDPTKWWKLLCHKPLKGISDNDLARLYRRARTTILEPVDKEGDFANIVIGQLKFEMKTNLRAVPELFAYMEKYGIGKRKADFYVLKAKYEYSINKNLQKAFEIVNLGLKAKAEPYQDLKDVVEKMKDELTKSLKRSASQEPHQSVNSVNSESAQEDRAGGKVRKLLSVEKEHCGRQSSSQEKDALCDLPGDDDATVKLEEAVQTGIGLINADDDRVISFKTPSMAVTESSRPCKSSLYAIKTSTFGKENANVPGTMVPKAQDGNTSIGPGGTKLLLNRKLLPGASALRVTAATSAPDSDYDEDDFKHKDDRSDALETTAENVSSVANGRSGKMDRFVLPNYIKDFGKEVGKGDSSISKTNKADGSDALETAAENLSTVANGRCSGRIESKQQSRLDDSLTIETAKKSRESPAESGNISPEHCNLGGPFAKMLEPKNTIVVNGLPYLKLCLLGKGGSSKVYRCIRPEGDVVAVKRVLTKGMEKKTKDSYANEIELLKKLAGESRIINLIDAEDDRTNTVIHMVLEAGDVDLAQLLLDTKKNSLEGESCSGLGPHRARVLWRQMLEAVECIHKNRIVHGDLKPANFLLVKGNIKLIDFGIAKAFSENTTNVYRESQVGTLNYMSPESILDSGVRKHEDTGNKKRPVMKVGCASDVWSLGCILYQIAYGRTPFGELHIIQKLQAITSEDYQIEFPPLADQSMREVLVNCLQRNPKKRPPISEKNGLLRHPYLCSETVGLPPSNPQTGHSLSVGLVQSIIESAMELQVSGKYSSVAEMSEAVIQKLNSRSTIKTNVQHNESRKNMKSPLAAKSKAAKEQQDPKKPAMHSDLKAAITAGKENLKPVSASNRDKCAEKQPATRSPKDMRAMLEKGLSKMLLARPNDTADESMDTSMTWTLG